MASGISLPIRVANGRLVKDSGETQLKKIISLALADCESGNPFQELGVDPAVIFSLNREEVRAYAKRRVIEVFKRLQAEGRATILSGYPVFKQEAEGELVCEIKYINLETTAAEELEMRGASPFELFRSLTTRAI